eukprot:TRINITY_DN983_c0_g1_i1.p1 TRINITY_DN983_c0_g1~~TRINITY_DN983_c0_g1_i1.p1  ORF type:complete len:226 (+),score=18.45 TRINITY_DN983_c0_g1_i1:205-882(+)
MIVCVDIVKLTSNYINPSSYSLSLLFNISLTHKLTLLFLFKVDNNSLCLSFIRSVVDNLNTSYFERVCSIYIELITTIGDEEGFTEHELNKIYRVLFDTMRQSVYHYLRKRPVDKGGARRAYKYIAGLELPFSTSGFTLAFEALLNELGFLLENNAGAVYLHKYDLISFRDRFQECAEIMDSKINTSHFMDRDESEPILFMAQSTHSPDLYDENDEEEDLNEYDV